MKLSKIPVLGCAVAAITIITVYLIARILGHVSGIPYISETGGKYPQYVIFAFGLTISAFLQASSVIIFSQILSSHVSKLNQKFLKLTQLGGLIMFVGLSGLSFVDTYDHLTLHSTLAQMYFITAFIVAIIFTITIHKLKSQNLANLHFCQHFDSQLTFKKRILTTTIICAIPYLTIMLWPFIPKTIYTRWIAAFFQYLTILSLMGYFGSLYYDLKGYELNISFNGSAVFSKFPYSASAENEASSYVSKSIMYPMHEMHEMNNKAEELAGIV
eukprot:TRINITY_DN404_c0_g1_i1.p1 TRINITY_DN404_c0_g1~~TRINITY_DN404_c0_g1_i1.p1  ORF type:complete len:272 (-),score=57.24 TRINITY_DN404_c0_g1_i1:145-960(-)